jgi:hypothetical protein
LSTYKKTGTTGIQGILLEIRLADHFIVRGLLNNYHSFVVGLNVEAAGKFDDVVFVYQKNENDLKRLRLVQAKNKKGSFNSNNLLKKSENGNDDLNLHMYLRSYHIIKNQLQNIKLEELVLLTLMAMDKNAKPVDGLSFTEMDEPIEGLLVFPQGKRFKMTPSNEVVEDMVGYFMKRIAIELIDHMLQKKEVRAQGFLANWQLMLFEHVLAPKPQMNCKSNASFRTDFFICGSPKRSAESEILDGE